MAAADQKIRIDKWLWAARFFKTRGMAQKAVNGGRIHINDQRVKAARIVEIGDKVHITRGEVNFTITILGLSKYRRPASEARLLYEESEESIQQRQEQRDIKRMTAAGHTAPAKRPGKRDRRKIRKFTLKE